MASVSVYNKEGKEVEKLELNDSVFAAPVNEHLVHRAVVLQLANKRQGTQKAKTRSEVRGGGRKPWRQKGTGHARQGSIQCSTVDRRRCCIRTSTKRLFFQDEQERESRSDEICFDY